MNYLITTFINGIFSTTPPIFLSGILLPWVFWHDRMIHFFFTELSTICYYYHCLFPASNRAIKVLGLWSFSTSLTINKVSLLCTGNLLKKHLYDLYKNQGRLSELAKQKRKKNKLLVHKTATQSWLFALLASLCSIC